MRYGFRTRSLAFLSSGPYKGTGWLFFSTFRPGLMQAVSLSRQAGGLYNDGLALNGSSRSGEDPKRSPSGVRTRLEYRCLILHLAMAKEGEPLAAGFRSVLLVCLVTSTLSRYLQIDSYYRLGVGIAGASWLLLRVRLASSAVRTMVEAKRRIRRRREWGLDWEGEKKRLAM